MRCDDEVSALVVGRIPAEGGGGRGEEKQQFCTLSPETSHHVGRRWVGQIAVVFCLLENMSSRRVKDRLRFISFPQDFPLLMGIPPSDLESRGRVGELGVNCVSGGGSLLRRLAVRVVPRSIFRSCSFSLPVC